MTNSKSNKDTPHLRVGNGRYHTRKRVEHLTAKGKRVYIRTFGCQMNDRDSEALLGLFVERGYAVAEDAKGADVVLVNTCSVRGHAEQRALSYAGSLKRATAKRGTQDAKRKIIGIIGCMAQNRGDEIFKKMPYIDLICGPGGFSEVPFYVEKIMTEKIRIIDVEDKKRKEDFYGADLRLEPGHAQVVISTGCSNFCSYCVVPYVRGRLRLRRPEDIVDEVKKNVSLGAKKITLLGQNVNDYNFKRGTQDAVRSTNFLDLLKMVEEIDGAEELDFITSQPKNTSRELFTLMAKSSKIKKHLHLPFQSGSDRILDLMNRGYTRQQYMDLVSDYKEIVGGTLSTDVIAGFPTEMEDDFLQTKEVLEKVRFQYAYIFKYSPRMRAESTKLTDDVLKETKERRHRILLDLQRKISLEKTRSK